MTAAAGRGALDTVDVAERELDLDLGGMTCASCANRIERKLAKIDGVRATVNFATERAHVRYPAGVLPAELVSAVESAGYSAAVSMPAGPAAAGPAEPAQDHLGRRRAIDLADQCRKPSPEPSS